MDIEIINCNNIDFGRITIKENSLNIKYAINGTGKSTVAKAISAAVAENNGATGRLTELTPFKHQEASIEVTPSVKGAHDINTVKIFDEAYINSFVFQQDELLKGSFDIFIRSEDFDAGAAEIDELVKTLKLALAEDPGIEELLKDFDEISASFGKPVKSGLHGSSGLAQAFKNGNNIENIPPGLEAYQTYLRHESGYKWIKWQQDGAAYLEIGEDCPYCTNDIKEKRTTIERVANTYNAKSIEHLNRIVSTFDRLKKYFSNATQAVIDEFVRNTERYSDEQVNVLHEVKNQIDNLRHKFKRSQGLGFASLKDVDKVIDELGEYKINLSLYNHLQSEETEIKANIVNNGVQELLNKAGLLQGAVAKQRSRIERVVQTYSQQINDFLINAGYSYQVVLQEDAESKHRLLLIHKESPQAKPVNAKNHLSFGERNAIALVLFMFDAVKTAPSLVVLDDPISSFDKNKKYAIIDMLFRKENSLRGKTVLLLTHDLDPVIDMLLHHTDRFEKPTVAFLENTNGTLTEKPIEKASIKTFIAINKHNAKLEIPTLNRLVYLRRLLEITNDKGVEFDIISNVFHRREKPTKVDQGDTRDMTAEEILAGCQGIQAHIPEFEYNTVVSTASDRAKMKALYTSSSCNYEKLHLYRIVFDDTSEGIQSPIVLKFINEAFHIENNYIYQLDPRDYQLVPQFIINECDKYMTALE